jgi:aryl-alcohol dehydrogenase-like predicted oxidoreductase
MRPYTNDRGYTIVETLVEIAGNHNAATPAQVAIAWLLANSTITSAIVGANTVKQLGETVPAVEIKLSPEEKARLDRLESPT